MEAASLRCEGELIRASFWLHCWLKNQRPFLTWCVSFWKRGWGHTEMIERGWRKPALSLPAQPGHLLGLSNLNQVCITRHKLSLDTERTVLSETVWTKKAGSIKQINMFRVFDLFFVHALCVLSIITSIVNSLLCRSRRGKKRMSFGSTEDEL